MNYFEMEVQKYWAPTSSMSAETKRQHLEQMAHSGQYIFSEKIDGNFTRGVITADRSALQTRGISKVTGTYSELQEKVFFWDSVVNAFTNGNTVLLGELYLPGKIDKDVGSISRCLVKKARERQEKNDEYLHWYIFDVLALDGVDMLNTPIEERVSHIDEVVKRINHPLVRGATYEEMDETFFDKVNDIFSRKGEGCVCYKKGITYTPGKRSSAWTTCKVKQEISNDVDVLITGLVPCEKNYNGGDIGNWELWRNVRTGELVHGAYFGEYQSGGPYEPVSKNFFNNWCGAIAVSVYDKNHELVPICNVAGLTEELKTELRDHFDDWYLSPLTIGGMMVSDTGTGTPSIRHPYIRAIRKDDLSPDDCTLEKILS